MNNSRQYISTYFLESISLEGTDKVKLMNRIDRKFWFHRDMLQPLLFDIQQDYFIMEINGAGVLPYTSTYYDTEEDKMFIAHHNGKRNRYKIRRRSYLTSNMSFLEIKFKTNKGRTIKKRIPTDYNNELFNDKEQDFINTTSPFESVELKSVLVNTFSRITLVNKDFSERCTIDLDLNYYHENEHIKLENLIIAEIKSDKDSSHSPLVKALLQRRINASSFSKYCIGRTLTNFKIKRNRFKEVVLKIERHIEHGKTLYKVNR